MRESLLLTGTALLGLACSQASAPSDLGDLGKADGLGQVCSSDQVFVGGLSSQQLSSSIVGGREVGADELALLSEVEKRQLIAAAVQLDFLFPSADVAADLPKVFAAADEGSVEILTISVGDGEDATEYDWVRFFAADAEVGVVFEDGSRNVVADVNAGAVRGCGPLAVDLNGVVCQADEEDFAATELNEGVVAGREISADDAEVSELEAEQLVKTAKHAGLEATTAAEVFALADEGTVEVLSLGIEEAGETMVFATWYRYFVADVEVGLIFEAETGTIVADVKGGLVRSCASVQDLLDDEIDELLFSKDVDGIEASVDIKELRAQEALAGNVVGFNEALAKAVDALFTDFDHPESPLALVLEEMGPEGTGCMATLDPVEALHCILNESGELTLAPFGQTAEGSASVEAEWIFELRTNFSDHIHWVVVNRADPAEPVRVSGFN